MTPAQYTVLEVLHKFTTNIFKKKSIGLYETTLKGHSMFYIMTEVFKKRGHTENSMDVLKELVSLQYINMVMNTVTFNSLCVCGRACKYTPRVVSIGKKLESTEGRITAKARELIGDDWTPDMVSKSPKAVEDKVRRARLRHYTPRTQDMKDKAFAEATMRIQQIEELKTQKRMILAEIKKLSA